MNTLRGYRDLHTRIMAYGMHRDPIKGREILKELDSLDQSPIVLQLKGLIQPLLDETKPKLTLIKGVKS